MKTIYAPHTEPEFEYEVLKPCPFCGKEVELQFVGNGYTRGRQVKIICRNCNITMLNATLRGSEWIAKLTIDDWNKRIYTEII